MEVCPVDCIYEGDTQLFIHPDECIDCGACEPVCPVKAIFAEDETPDQWKSFIELNKQFFKDNPGRQAGHQVVGARFSESGACEGPSARALRFVHRRHGRLGVLGRHAGGGARGNPAFLAWHRRCECLRGVMNAMPQPTASPAAPVSSGTPAGYHGAVSDFKRRLIEATLHQMRG